MGGLVANKPLVLQEEVGSVIKGSPVPLPSCGQVYEYTAEAFISEENGGRLGARTSPLSEPFYLDGPVCPETTVEFMFSNLWIGGSWHG